MNFKIVILFLKYKYFRKLFVKNVFGILIEIEIKIEVALCNQNISFLILIFQFLEVWPHCS